MASDPIGDDLRKQRRRRRLGRDAACVVCGETNPEVLRRLPRSLLERHHLAGRANDAELTAVVCLNHHAILSEAQRDSGVDLASDPDRRPAELTVGLLRGLADLTELLTPSLRRHADELDARENDHNDECKEE